MLFKDIKNLLNPKVKPTSKFGNELFNRLEKYLQKYPHIDNITWTQYTPYFADGSPCVFEANLLYATLININGNEEHNTPANKYFQTHIALWAEKQTEQMKNLFGDHSEVIVTKSGIDVRFYPHD